MTRSSRSPIQVAFVTIVPSPYQIDLFRALSLQPEVELSVFYMEEGSPDSPWPSASLQSYERYLPGLRIGSGPNRIHINRSLPDFEAFDVVVLSSYTSITGQWLMRRKLRGRRWLYWGERMRLQPGRLRATLQQMLSEPIESSAGIVGMGSLAVMDYQGRFPGSRLFNIPYYCDIEAFRTRVEKKTISEYGPIHFLCCAQMIHRKGIDLLLEAFDRLVGDGLLLRLILVGREAELPEMLRGVSPGARACIEYRGFHAPADLPVDFADADVFVLPSRHDGWGVVVNQALGAGLPLICSDAVGAAHDMLEPGVNGLMVEAGNVESLQNAIRHLANNRDLIRMWGQASNDMARCWTPARGARKWVDVLTEVIHG